MGKVYLIGAGPGDPELLTLKAARLLAEADVVLHDSLVSPEVLQRISPRAEIVDVGKRAATKLLTQDEINSLLVAYAADHEVVVRLKGGDPLIFGRAGEEIEALRNARLEFEIVPGITAALGAAAAAGIALTDRRVASQLLFATFSRDSEHQDAAWSAISNTTTLAVYMPGRDYGAVATRLLDAGLSGDTPCVIVSQASSPHQQVTWSQVADLFEAPHLPAPALLIIGRVAVQSIREQRLDAALATWASSSQGSFQTTM
jgi:uroporphyrin-III C-methyltransferase